MIKILLFLIISLYFLFQPTSIFAQQPIPQTIYGEAQVLNVSDSQMKIKVLSEKLKDKEFTIQFYMDAQSKNHQVYKMKDRIIFSYSKDQSGHESINIIDLVRNNQLIWLFIFFMVMVIGIGRWKGLLSFLGMVFSFIIIMNMIIPNILAGNDPIMVSILAAAFIVPVTFYIAHGINSKTTVSIISTFLTLVLTALISYIFIQITRLTGNVNDEVMYLQLQNGAINIKNLLLAGIIIGAMGVLDDITISQTTIVETINRHNKKLNFLQLFQEGMRVGRDHIASLVNTLVLVYAGASLPLFLLFYNAQMPYGYVINQEIITTEIVRTLVSSIGIIAAVPITTFFACYIVLKQNK